MLLLEQQQVVCSTEQSKIVDSESRLQQEWSTCQPDLDGLDADQRSLLSQVMDKSLSSIASIRLAADNKLRLLETIRDYITAAGKNKPYRLQMIEIQAVIDYCLLEVPIGVKASKKQSLILHDTTQAQHSDFLIKLIEKRNLILQSIQLARTYQHQAQALQTGVNKLITNLGANLPERALSVQGFKELLSSSVHLIRNPAIASDKPALDFLLKANMPPESAIQVGAYLVCRQRTQHFKIPIPVGLNREDFDNPVDLETILSSIRKEMAEFNITDRQHRMPSKRAKPTGLFREATLRHFNLLRPGMTKLIQLDSYQHPSEDRDLWGKLALTFSKILPHPANRDLGTYFDTTLYIKTPEGSFRQANANYKNQEDRILTDERVLGHSGDKTSKNSDQTLLQYTYLKESPKASELLILAVSGYGGANSSRPLKDFVAAGLPPVMLVYNQLAEDFVQAEVVPALLSEAQIADSSFLPMAYLKPLAANQYILHIPELNTGLKNVNTGDLSLEVQKYLVKEAEKAEAAMQMFLRVVETEALAKPADPVFAGLPPLVGGYNLLDNSNLCFANAHNNLVALDLIEASGIEKASEVSAVHFISHSLPQVYKRLKSQERPNTKLINWGPATESRNYPPLGSVMKGSNALLVAPVQPEQVEWYQARAKGLLTLYHVTGDTRWNPEVMYAATEFDNSTVIYYVESATLSADPVKKKGELTAIIEGLQTLAFMPVGPFGLCIVAIDQHYYLQRPVCTQTYQGLLPENINLRFQEGYPEITEYLGEGASALVAWHKDVIKRSKFPAVQEKLEKRAFGARQYWTVDALLNAIQDGNSLKTVLEKLPLVVSALHQWSIILPVDEFNQLKERFSLPLLAKLSSLLMENSAAYQKAWSQIQADSSPEERIDSFARLAEAKMSKRKFAAIWNKLEAALQTFSHHGCYSASQRLERMALVQTGNLQWREAFDKIKGLVTAENLVVANNVTTAYERPIDEILETLGSESLQFFVDKTKLLLEWERLKSKETQGLLTQLAGISSYNRLGASDTYMYSGMILSCNLGNNETIPRLCGHSMQSPKGVFLGLEGRDRQLKSLLLMPMNENFAHFQAGIRRAWTHFNWISLANSAELAEYRIRLRGSLAHSLNEGANSPDISHILLRLWFSIADNLKEEFPGQMEIGIKGLRNVLGQILTTMASGQRPFSPLYLFLSDKELGRHTRLSLSDLYYLNKLLPLLEHALIDTDSIKAQISTYLKISCERAIHSLRLKPKQRTALANQLTAGVAIADCITAIEGKNEQEKANICALFQPLTNNQLPMPLLTAFVTAVTNANTLQQQSLSKSIWDIVLYSDPSMNQERISKIVLAALQEDGSDWENLSVFSAGYNDHEQVDSSVLNERHTP